MFFSKLWACFKNLWMFFHIHEHFKKIINIFWIYEFITILISHEQLWKLWTFFRIHEYIFHIREGFLNLRTLFKFKNFFEICEHFWKYTKKWIFLMFLIFWKVYEWNIGSDIIMRDPCPYQTLIGGIHLQENTLHLS